MERKSTMLKVTSILLIIFASIEIMISITGIGISAYLPSESELAQMSGADLVESLEGIITLLIMGVYQLVMGIIGILSFEKREKANQCFGMGILIAGFVVANTFLKGLPSDSYRMGRVLFGMCLRAALPILYAVGAYQLKKKHAIPPETEFHEEKSLKKYSG